MENLCCCGCGNQVESGRRAHICTITGKSLFAGFCQATEDNGPCRRCVGSEDATSAAVSKDISTESQACISCGGYLDADTTICFECSQIIKSGCIICETVVLPDAFEVKSRVCKACIDNLAPLVAPRAHVIDVDAMNAQQDAISSVEAVAPLALAALAEA